MTLTQTPTIELPVCDGCGETFVPEPLEDDEVFDLDEQLEEGWVNDAEGTYCATHKNLHPDHIEYSYGQNILA